MADAIVWASGGHIIGIDDNPTPASIISMSFSGRGPCPSFLQSAIDLARNTHGATLYAAAGNNPLITASESFPANCVGVVSVGASDETGIQLASYSARNADTYFPGGVPGSPIPCVGPYMVVQGCMGTSMSVSHAGGTLAIDNAWTNPFSSFFDGMQLSLSPANDTSAVYIPGREGTNFTVEGAALTTGSYTYATSTTYARGVRVNYKIDISNVYSVDITTVYRVCVGTTVFRCYSESGSVCGIGTSTSSTTTYTGTTTVYRQYGVPQVEWFNGGASSCTVGTNWLRISWTARCKAGYRDVSGVCTICTRNTYSSNGATTCTACASGKYSLPGAALCTTCGTTDCKDGVQAYPPGAIGATTSSDFTTSKTLSGQPYANGLYSMAWSSQSTTNSPSMVFNSVTNSNVGGHWKAFNYAASTGAYAVASNPTFLVAGYIGDWITVTMPVRIFLSYIKIYARASFSHRATKDYLLYGRSSSSSPWTLIMGNTNIAYSSNLHTSAKLALASQQAYSQFGFVVGKLQGGGDQLNFEELVLYGQEALVCTAGSFFSFTNYTCLQCPLGQFVATSGKYACTTCAAGTYADVLGSTACKNCPAGTFLSTTGATSIAQCTPCTPGSFQSAVASSSCISCSPATYSNISGASACTFCPTGTSSSQTGASSITTCLVSKSLETIAISCKNIHVCAILENNQSKCWGSNAVGQLGYGDAVDRGDNPYEMGNILPYIDLGTNRTPTQVSTGNGFTCALLQSTVPAACTGSTSVEFPTASLLTATGFLWASNNGMWSTITASGQFYELKSSSVFDNGAGDVRHLGLMFDKDGTSWNGWSSEIPNGVGFYSGGIYRGIYSTTYYDSANRAYLYRGEWVQIRMPFPLLISSYKVTSHGHPTDALGRCPTEWVLVGSNDDENWYFLDTRANVFTTELGSQELTFTVAGNTNRYEYFRICFGRSGGTSFVALGELKILAQQCSPVDGMNSIKCWGNNNYGQLGIGTTVNVGDAAGEMGNSLAAINVGTSRTVRGISMGGDHACAILDNRQTKCWGRNNFGQLGIGNTANAGDAAAEMGDTLIAANLGTYLVSRTVSSGYLHTCAILNNSLVKCWGYNGYGNLGIGTTTVVGTAAAQMGDTLAYTSLGTGRAAKQLAAGRDHTCVILDNDLVKCWGYNLFGQLGLNHTNNMGDNANEMGNSLPFVSLGTGRTAKQISAGWHHMCVILDNNLVKCWGQNTAAQLGLGDTLNRGDNANEMGDNLPYVNIGAGRTAKAITTGSTTCVLMDNNLVKCWGSGLYGTTGSGTTNDVLSPPVYTTVNIGDYACSFCNPGTFIKTQCSRFANTLCQNCSTGFYSLDGLTSTSCTACKAGTFSTAVGASSASACTPCPAGRISTSTASTNCSICPAATFSLLGSTVCTQCPAGTYSTQTGATNLSACLQCPQGGYSAAGSTSCKTCQAGSYSIVPGASCVPCPPGTYSTTVGSSSLANCLACPSGTYSPIPGATSSDACKTWKDMLVANVSLQGSSGGASHSCAILEGSVLKCWGLNANGQLGLGDMLNRGKDSGEMGNLLPSVDLGTGRTAARVAVGGSAQTCAIMDNAQVKCWGINTNGQLGIGDRVQRGSAAGQMGNALPQVLSL